MFSIKATNPGMCGDTITGKSYEVPPEVGQALATRKASVPGSSLYHECKVDGGSMLS